MSATKIVISSLVLVSIISSISEGDIDVSENKTGALKTKDSAIRPDQDGLCTDPVAKFEFCPSGPELDCSALTNNCLKCYCSLSCRYGHMSEATCDVPEGIICKGERKLKRNFTCAFCYQSDDSLQVCEENTKCDSISDPNNRNYIANCTVDQSTICFGRRHFHRQKKCNWTGGHRWLTALLLSITLGGFGADRFYLGHWQEGIGKLFSFGGLGVWTLVDVVMIAVRYVGPSDGSLYI